MKFGLQTDFNQPLTNTDIGLMAVAWLLCTPRPGQTHMVGTFRNKSSLVSDVIKPKTGDSMATIFVNLYDVITPRGWFDLDKIYGMPTQMTGTHSQLIHTIWTVSKPV